MKSGAGCVSDWSGILFGTSSKKIQRKARPGGERPKKKSAPGLEPIL